MFRRSLVLLLSLTLGSACRLSGPAVHTGPDIRPTREPALAAQVTLEVMTKRTPDTFVAKDGSTCMVGPDVYASTRTGSMYRCRWVRNK